MKAKNAVQNLYKVRSAIEQLKIKEDTLKLEVNSYLDRYQRNDCKSGDLMAVRNVTPSNVISMRLAKKVLTSRMITKISEKKYYSFIKIRKVK